jgi:hypothetical protein
MRPESATMSRRLLVCWLLFSFFLGCHVTDGKAPTRKPNQPLSQSPGTEVPAAIPSDQPALSAPRTNDLAAAAIFLEKGDDVGACFHLGRFVQQHPDHANARLYFAELLEKLGKRNEARLQYERIEADAQDARPPDLSHQIHLHSRLLEIAEADEDDFCVHLHRGIGLWLLAQRRAKLKDPDGDLPVEGLLCKAAGELTMAHALKPNEARPTWYLFAVWRQLAQPQQARKWLALAQDAAPFTPLTSAEQRRLHLASFRLHGE